MSAHEGRAQPSTSMRRTVPHVTDQLSDNKAMPRKATQANHMESSVTRLLVATKLLLESLTQWAQRKESETNVSRVYVRLGNDFNASITAFMGAGIDMTDLYSVPADLRVCLESCLSEEASTTTLERHLPRIRDIIVRLLQGLKTKQAYYKQLQMESSPSSASSVHGHSVPASRAEGPSGPRAPGSAYPLPTPVSAPTQMGSTTLPEESSQVRSQTPHQTPHPLPARSPRQVPPTPQERPASRTSPSLSTRSASLPQPPPVAPADNSTPPTPASTAEQAQREDINVRLRNSDTLERRASKRFSAYTFNKIGAGLMSSVGSTPTSLHSYTERRTPQSAGLRSVKQVAAADLEVPSPTKQNHASHTLLTSLPEADTGESKTDASSTYSHDEPFMVYLQVNRQTRKVTLPVDHAQSDRGLNLAMLRMLFVDQFSYSSGKSDFPDIYIKDPSNGVAYQLEDMSDIQPKSVLMLNVEPLDQIKEHVDFSISALSRELHELKAMIRDNAAREATRPAPVAPVETTPIADAEFQRAGDRMSTQLGAPAVPQDKGNDYATDLKTHYEALQKLRHDFAILRQVQDEGEHDMRQLMANLREKAKEMSRVVSLGPSAGRNLIESGKTHLDAQSQQVLTNVEDLQDLIEDLKLDVSHRGVKPKAAELKRATADIATATQRLMELEQYIQSVRPHWKKTWENELQFIVDEQEFLNYQEGLLADLKQDLTAVQDVFGNIQQIVKLRDVGQARGDDPGRGPRYVPPPPDGEHEGLPTVMVEVRGQSIDHERRLRALQAAERSREKAKAGRTDEFADELQGFVDNRTLRRTGGHLEAERVRQKRDQSTLRAMFEQAP